MGLVDQAINGLVRDSQLLLRPMTQQQIAATLARSSRLDAAQSVFLDKLIARADEQQRASRCTTLDSGIQSSGVASPTGAAPAPSRRRFSLSRSLSFRASRPILEPKQASQPPAETGKAGLAGLLRSRSMRVISSARRSVSEKPSRAPQATIDYLSSAQARRRASSAFSRARESSSSRLGLFLRRLFVGNRKVSSTSERDSPREPSRRVSAEPTISSLPRAAPSSRPPSSSSNSSATNSLMEILDCSPELPKPHQRRHTDQASASIQQADWRLIKRSDSSLSHNSLASSSTTKSTASQQLRRHLDEAYRRHRNCTSQRDKEFIDSINILRQASRHALQNSRSSSKNRRAKSAGARSANSDDTTSSLGSSCAVCESPSHLCRCHRLAPDDLIGQINPLPGERWIDEPAPDCCACNSYLNSARLCPLACLPAYPCCPASHRPDQISEMCCPIWRSLLASYWPPVPGFPPVLAPNQPLPNQMPNQPLESYAASHQHQHNTTIDLKIEIGSKLAEQERFAKTGRLLVEPDDSLDSNLTEESLCNRQVELDSQASSLQSELMSDSLQADQQE